MTGRGPRPGIARLAALAALALVPGAALADKGHLAPRPVALSEPAQRAILLHDRGEEILVLGVELQAERRGEVLEFIPFPSEPEVSRVGGDPLGAAARLVGDKRLAFDGPATKGGAGGPAPAAVEIALEARLGLHDVTVIRVHDAKGFEGWVRAWVRARGAGGLDLAAVVPLAEDYVRRGYPWFVFDRVTVEPGRRHAEPLAYRFRSARMYYPLKTSNVVGGRGIVQVVFLSPGTFAVEEAPDAAQRFWAVLRRATGSVEGWRVSTSAKIAPADAEGVVPGAAQLFAETPKLYLQVLEYGGPYRFADDLALDPADLRPFARKPIPWAPPGAPADELAGFAPDEVADYCEANPARPPCASRAAPPRVP